MAVSDGGPSGGLGETADVVERTRRLGTPVEVIWPDGADHPIHRAQGGMIRRHVIWRNEHATEPCPRTHVTSANAA